ncbi:hypothetical protein J2W22_002058 [Sphingomonas kyeonggiensis]|uniref:hypothetical protein n=1 Tax=Sphingomonas kyeonggiensis TaxID=1268553 RepID=UPI00277D5213|nr:hypothetical protein [Sphingomonas kyeonggiensis]MDQ0249994.1 hypothetical protein [Sphingomonas kyeonggiensis]
MAIPLEKNHWALGVVISPGTSFFMGVALARLNDPVVASDLQVDQLRMFSWTNDAEVFRGNWLNLGINLPVPHVKLPDYKVYVGEKEMVESFDGSSLRSFDAVADEGLTFRKIRSPLLVQDAVQAALGLGAWKAGYQDMMHGSVVVH